jgi:hypothetical protein
MEREIMKIIIITLCVFIAFIPYAYAGELYKCIDSKGNPIITNAPQDGMTNCVPEGADEDSSPKNNITSQKGTGKNSYRRANSRCDSVSSNMNNARIYLNQAANGRDLEKGKEDVGQAITFLNEAETMSGLCECPSSSAEIAYAAQYAQQANSANSVSQFSDLLTKAIRAFNNALEAFKRCR